MYDLFCCQIFVLCSLFFFFFCYQMLSLVKRYYVKKNQIKVALTSCDKKVYIYEAMQKKIIYQ
jgi:hypothetical protein